MGIVIRVILTYLFLWLCFRILGKRELSRMAPLEIVTLLLIPQLFSRALPGEDYSMTNAIVGASTLVCLVFLGSATTYRSRWLSKMTLPSPTVLVEHGHWVEPHMHQERMTPTEVFDAMHHSGLSDLAEVQWAVLQADGKIAIIPYPPQHHS